MKYLISALIFVTSILSSFSSLAYEKGDVLLRMGVSLVEPHEESDSLSITNPPIGALDNVLGSKTGLSVGDALALAGTVSYVLDENWGIETLIGLPVELDVSVTGLRALGLNDLASLNILPLTISLQYYPTMDHSPFQVYAGVGLNYAYMSNVDLDDSVQASLMAEDVDFSFNDSFGLVLDAGIDWEINDKWFANASVCYFTLETDVEADITQSAVLGGLAGSGPIDAQLETSVKANVFIYFVTAGYRF